MHVILDAIGKDLPDIQLYLMGIFVLTPSNRMAHLSQIMLVPLDHL
jgi:hypothetical protein